MTTADHGLTKPTYSVPETAALLSITDRTLFRMVKAGDIRSVKVGRRRTVFLRSDIERYLNRIAGIGSDMGST